MNMKNRIGLICISLLLLACNPYKGFKGVEKKGMKKRKTPSQELRDDYEKLGKKSQRAYKKEMKRKHKKLGTKEGT